MATSGFVVWFTGLSGSGKSTLASMLAAELASFGVHVESLDGDVVRTHLSKGLGFSREDRDTNIRRIGFVAKLVARSGGCAITAAISPYREIRDEQRRVIERFCEVYCECPIDVLSRRDAKGLYARALAGEIKGFTGVDDPYEPPLSPEVVVHTDREAPAESLTKIMAKLEELGWISRVDAARGASEERRRLVAPHGGELVDRFVRGEARQRLLERARSLPIIALDERGASDLELIGSGAFSPLKGFMGPRDYLRVVREQRLESGLVWSIPVTLAVSEAKVSGLAPGMEVTLTSPDGRIVGVLELGDRWKPDKMLEALEVYGTKDERHPGVRWLASSGDVYLGGEVWLVERPLIPQFPRHPQDPAATRALFEARGWRKIVGFQTRNPLHRAHEYLTKCALEITDGLLLHPLVGETKEGDIAADVRMRCYEELLARYYPTDRVVLATFPAAMRYAGPREAIFHALVRKNYGCSHFIVGRDHAGVGGFYGPHEAQYAFEAFAPSELGIEPLAFDDAFWSKVTGEMATAKTAPGDATTRLSLSGTQVRELLREGKLPPPELTRPEVAKILLEEAQRPVAASASPAAGSAQPAAALRDRVREVVVIASSSRSGSSLFAEWLRRSGHLLHLRGEPNPLLRSVGLLTGSSGNDGPSDALDATDVPRDHRLDELLARDIGRPVPTSAPLDVPSFAADWHWRLGLEWPKERFDSTDVDEWVDATLRAIDYAPGDAFDVDAFSLRFLARVAERHPCVSPYRYDLPAELIATREPELAVPDAPPGDTLIEEPPFILVAPWTRARPAEIGEQPLVLKTPSAGYQMPFYRELFPSARIRVIHLVRNPAATINGLLDGWAHHEFFSRHLPDRLQIRGYTDVHPAWARSWWKFDLPPGWEEVAHASLAEVCAFQWSAAHRAILQSIEEGGYESLRIRFEDFVADDARRTRERVWEWLGRTSAPTSADLDLPRVMSTRPPRPFRWKERAGVIEPLLETKSVRELTNALGYGGDHANWR